MHVDGFERATRGNKGLPRATHLLGRSIVYWPGLLAAVLPITLVAALLLAFVNVIHDRVTEGRVHPLSWWFAIGSFVWFNVVQFRFGRLPVWLRFSERWIGTG